MTGPISLRLSKKDDPKFMLRHLLRLDQMCYKTIDVYENGTVHSPTNLPLRKIGEGACGMIFEKKDCHAVLKMAKPTFETELWRDYLSHQKIREKLREHGCQVLIPNIFYYAPFHDKSGRWKDLADRLPLSAGNDILVSERISPLAAPIRRALVDAYCPEKLRTVVKDDAASNDCLARIYLGRRRDPARRPNTFFTLRNFALCVDQMEELDLEIHMMAKRIAESLAVIHWGARTDARDIEFVLASAPVPVVGTMREDQEIKASSLVGLPERTSTVHDFIPPRQPELYTLHVCVLDFNQVRPITLDKDGVLQAVRAFFLNDPYYPRPLGSTPSDRKLWGTFEHAYLRKAANIIQTISNDFQHLPTLFIKKVIEEQAQRMAKRAMRPTDDSP